MTAGRPSPACGAIELKRVPNGKRKAAISSIIGGLFVLAIMVLGLASVVYVSSLENNVHAAQNSVAQIDVARNQERLNVVNTLFGGTQTYTPSQSYVTGGSCVNTCGLTMVVGNGFRYGNTVWCSNAAVCGSSNYVRGTLEPGYAPFNVTSQTTTGTQQLVSDMNFSSGINGWAVYTTSSQVIGGYASTQGNSVPGSGVGAMYVGASFISGATVSNNETTRFYLNPTSTGTGTITQAAFSFAEFFSQNAFSSATLSSYTYNLYLIDETSGANYLMWTNTVTTANKADTQWNYNTGINNLVSGGRNGAGGPIASVLTHNGYYDIVLQTTIVFKSGTCGTTCPAFLSH